MSGAQPWDRVVADFADHAWLFSPITWSPSRGSSDVGAVFGRAAKSHELLFTVRSGESVGSVPASSVRGRTDERASHEPRIVDGTAPKPGVRDLFNITAS